MLCCTPTYALHLGTVAGERGPSLRDSRVRAIVVGGEAGGSIAATRARIEELWPGATVYDHHGMTEVGPVSHACPAAPGVLHVLEDRYLCELVDPATGAPVAPGGREPGELVLTTLGREGSPALRYRTGDLVRAGPRGACACGRTTQRLEGGILARADEMVVVRGVNLFPSAVEELVRSVPGITEYRVEVDRSRPLAEVRLQIEASGAHAARQLQEEFRRVYGLRVPVQLARPGELPRFELKAKRWQ